MAFGSSRLGQLMTQDGESFFGGRVGREERADGTSAAAGAAQHVMAERMLVKRGPVERRGLGRLALVALGSLAFGPAGSGEGSKVTRWAKRGVGGRRRR